MKIVGNPPLQVRTAGQFLPSLHASPFSRYISGSWQFMGILNGSSVLCFDRSISSAQPIRGVRPKLRGVRVLSEDETTGGPEDQRPRSEDLVCWYGILIMPVPHLTSLDILDSMQTNMCLFISRHIKDHWESGTVVGARPVTKAVRFGCFLGV